MNTVVDPLNKIFCYHPQKSEAFPFCGSACRPLFFRYHRLSGDYAVYAMRCDAQFLSDYAVYAMRCDAMRCNAQFEAFSLGVSLWRPTVFRYNGMLPKSFLLQR